MVMKKETINPQHRGKPLTCDSRKTARLLHLLPCRVGDAHPALCDFFFLLHLVCIHQVVIVVLFWRKRCTKKKKKGLPG